MDKLYANSEEKFVKSVLVYVTEAEGEDLVYELYKDADCEVPLTEEEAVRLFQTNLFFVSTDLGIAKINFMQETVDGIEFYTSVSIEKDQETGDAEAVPVGAPFICIPVEEEEE